MSAKVPDEKLRGELNKYREETNAIFYSLSRTLITLAVISITVSPSFIGQKLHNNLAVTLYVDSMGIALISIFAGIAQYYRDYNGFKDYTSYMATIVYRDQSDWDKRERKLVEKFSDAYDKNGTFNTGHAWQVLQVLTVLTSLTLLLIVIHLSF